MQPHVTLSGSDDVIEEYLGDTIDYSTEVTEGGMSGTCELSGCVSPVFQPPHP